MNISRWDYVIIGAGPAGLQLAYFLQKSSRQYLVLEEGERAGTFFNKFPRHRTLISINKTITGIKNHDTNLRWDWNSLISDDHDFRFASYSDKYFPSADSLVRYLCDFAEKYRLHIRYNARVTLVRRDGDFVIECADGVTIRAKRLVVASGFGR